MAIKVNNTTVINDSRALQNIASVDSATATAIGNAGVGGGLLKELYNTAFTNINILNITSSNIGATTYEEYEIHGHIKLTSANYWTLASRVGTGTTLHSNSTYSGRGNTSSSGWSTSNISYWQHNNPSNQNYSGTVSAFPFRINILKASSYTVMMRSWFAHTNGSSQGIPSHGGGIFTSAGSGNVNQFQFFSSSGNNITGEMWVYGVDR